MTDKCSTEGCQLTEKYDGKCALHCIKGKYQSDKMKGVLDDFYRQLAEYILLEKLDLLTTNQVEDIELRVMLQGGLELPLCKIKVMNERKDELINKILSDENNSVLEELKKYISVFQDIIFPERDSRDYFDYFKLFRKLRGVHFDLSEINFTNFNFSDVHVFFQDCTFRKSWSINPYSLLDDVESKSVFQNCTFQDDVRTASAESSRDTLTLDDHLFNDCHFDKKLCLNRGQYKKSIFNNTTEFRQKLVYFHMEKCELKSRFMLNNADIDSLIIQDIEFEEKFELKENTIKKTVISNVNFQKLFDAYRTNFLHFKISRSIFHDFAGFEKCEFGLKYGENSHPTEFEYVTFLDFTNFRKAKFINGLDFEHTNIKEPLNFLNAEIEAENTNRETYRIIKHSFDKIGNKIEANKYFAYEMQAHSKELKKSGWSSERLIFTLNKAISNFGASYKKPFILMLITSLLYFILVLGYEHNFLYKNPTANIKIDMIFSHLNNFAKGIPPYGRFLKEGMEFVTLLFHIIFLTFTWHFIIAIKRHTNR